MEFRGPNGELLIADANGQIIPHGANHINGGGDPIDGDRIHIDEVPSNYTPASGGAAASADDLSAHFRGLDQKLDHGIGIPEMSLDAWGPVARQQGFMLMSNGNTGMIDDGAGNVQVLDNAMYIMNSAAGGWVRVGSASVALGNWEYLYVDVPPTAAQGSIVTPQVGTFSSTNRDYDHEDRFVIAQRWSTGRVRMRGGREAQPETVTATQNAIQTSVSSSLVDLPGASISLSPGVWSISGNFASSRCWNNGASNDLMLFYWIIRDGSNNHIEEARHYFYHAGSIAQRQEVPYQLNTVVTPSVTTTYKLSGYCYLVSGSNFAGGFRWDSGNGFPATIKAVRH